MLMLDESLAHAIPKLFAVWECYIWLETDSFT